ncbi:MAG: lanthionine synthetase C family protein [Actinobacteria bacterium]|nr:lanthionine synthetase C family protein [Actinomycetota bacterium]
MTSEHLASAMAGAVADRLARPDTVPTHLTEAIWWRQSLAHGAPGIALLHVERAAAGLGPWERAHDWLAYTARAALTTGPDSHLFYGAPALAHVLACAAAHRPGAYTRALARLDHAIAVDTHNRVGDAHARMDRGELPALADFDVIRGLSGVGSLLLRRDPHGLALHAVLDYLVRLTEPVRGDGQALPGWWTTSSPSGRDSGQFPGGHGNTGVAHGIGGVLALQALATRHGITVDGQREAMGRICAWLDRWRTDTGAGPVWPYWVNLAHLRAGHHDTTDRQPPSWCYGTAGLARAQQLAAMATGDTHRQDFAERALVQALSGVVQRSTTTNASLCHGYAGFAHIASIVAADASTDAAAALRALTQDLLNALQPADVDPAETAARLVRGDDGPGFLEGAAGIALAVLAPSAATRPQTGWDTCLLIT